MEINVSIRFVDAIYDLIGYLTQDGIDSVDLEGEGPANKAIIYSSTLSLINNMTSIRGMSDSLFANLDPDLENQLLLEEPFIARISSYYRNLPKQITQKDLKHTAQSISKEAILFSSFDPSKEDIYKFLISVLEFYLLDKEIDFNHVIKDPDIIKEINDASWLFERSHNNIKKLFLSKVTNNEFFLDVDFLYLLAVNSPQYINEALTSLNLRFLEKGSNIHSENFKNDLKKFKSIQASKNAKIKADKEALKKAPLYQKLEKLWDEGEWSSKGRGKYSKFATDVLYHDEIDGLEFDAIRNHISKYDKAKV